MSYEWRGQGKVTGFHEGGLFRIIPHYPPTRLFPLPPAPVVQSCACLHLDDIGYHVLAKADLPLAPGPITGPGSFIFSYQRFTTGVLNKHHSTLPIISESPIPPGTPTALIPRADFMAQMRQWSTWRFEATGYTTYGQAPGLSPFLPLEKKHPPVFPMACLVYMQPLKSVLRAAPPHM